MIKQFLIDYEKDLKKKNKTCNNINILYIIYLFSILGGLIIIISKDFLLFFICLELINFSSIVILLYKENRLSTNITLIYLIINSISSILILLGILYIYIENNIIDILEIENIFNSFIWITNNIINNNIKLNNYISEVEFSSKIIYFSYIYYYLDLIISKCIFYLNIVYNNILNNNNNYYLATYLIFIGLLIKLGVTPFHFIIIILYSTLPNIIILYHSIIPKIIYFFILYNLYFIINKTIYIYIILSFIIGAIIGLNRKSIKKLLASSSILNMGFILLSIYNIYYYIFNNTLEFYSYNLLYNENIKSFSLYNLPYSFIPFNILHFLVLYIINNINIFSILILFYNIRNIKDIKSLYSTYPFINFLFLISILSFIGIPPLGGFYAKYFVLFNSILNLSYLNSSFFIFLLISSIISILISSIFYLSFIKYLFNSYTSLYIYNNIKLLYLYPNYISYILSFSFSFLFFFSFLFIYYIYILNIFNL